MLSFGPFRLDVPNACVWRGTAALRMSPKAFAVLCMLVDQAGELVSKETLLETAWSDVAVSDAVLTVCIGDLRRLLGDSARAPQFIETIHRRGYRFIAPVTRIGDSMPASVASRLPLPVAPLLVGRETELRRLHDGLAKALHGERQVVFVTGEPGIGKTALVDAFVAQLAAAPPLWTVRGQCIAHYGMGEAYLPVLSALEQLCRQADGEQALAQLERYAPTWLVNMPSLLSATELNARQRNVQSATPERMLREITEALEALTAMQPLVLVLEDMHWGDTATIDLLAWLARRRQTARLMLVGTYRPVDVIVRQHPLRTVIQELALHRLCVELPLELLNQAEVGQYLTIRYSKGVLPETLSSLLYQRTEGNPLFLVTLLEALEHQGIVWDTLTNVEAALQDVPQSLRGMVEQQLAACSAQERQVLEAASVAGVTFTAAAMAPGVEETVETTEQCYTTLASRGQFLQESGLEVWPDGTVTQKFGFRHALYREVLYGDMATARRARLHRTIGERLESGYGGQTEKIAGVLAEHFARGRDDAKAVAYRQLAAEVALKRSAHREVIGHLRQGLAAVERLPASLAQTQQELLLQTMLGTALMTTKGQGVAEVEQIYARAWQLCQQIGDTEQGFSVLRGLMLCYQAQGQLRTAHRFGEKLLRLAQSQNDSARLLLAHYQIGMVSFYLGEPTSAYTHHQQVFDVYTPQAHQPLVLRYGLDLGMTSHSWLSWDLWQLGYPDQALTYSQSARTLAEETSHPYSLAQVITWAAVLHQLRREIRLVHEHAVAAMALTTEQGFAQRLARVTVLRGWALAMHGRSEAGIAELRQGLAASRTSGAKMLQMYALGLLAEAYGKAGQPDEGLRLLAEAIAMMEATEARFYGAELYRLKGALLLKQAIRNGSQAESCFHQALSVARRQQAKSWELRAATSLARLWQSQGKRQDAYDLLAPVYSWFTEGFDAADLKDAKALLLKLQP